MAPRGPRTGAFTVAALLALLAAGVRAGEEKEKRQSVAELLAIIHSERDFQKRHTALWRLRRHPGAEAMAALTTIADTDHDSRMRKAAIQLIGEMGCAHRELIGKRQLRLLEGLLERPDSGVEYVREEAVSRYVELRGTAAIPKLLEVLAAEPSATVRFRILFRGDTFWTALKATPDILAKVALEDPDERVREFAAKALADIADARAVEALEAYVKQAPAKAAKEVILRLARSRRVSQERLAEMLEPRVKDDPATAFWALCIAGDRGRDAVQPETADLALRFLPLLPPEEKHQAFQIIGRKGSLRHLPILAEGDDPKRLEERYGPIAPETLARFRDAKANGMSSIRFRCVPRKPAALRELLADPAWREEFVVGFPWLWSWFREPALADALMALSREELERAVLPLAREGLDGLYEVYDPIARLRPEDGALILCRMYEEFVDAGGSPSVQLRYFLHSLASTEQRLAAEFLYREWKRARAAGEAGWAETVLVALLSFKTSVAEDVTLRLLAMDDIHWRYQAVQQLGRIGTDRAYTRLLWMLLTQPDEEFGRGIVLRTHEILRRSLAQIRERMGWWAYLGVARLAALPLGIVALGVSLWIVWRRQRRSTRDHLGSAAPTHLENDATHCNV